MSEFIKDIRLVSAEKYKQFTTDNISDDNIAYLINSEELLLKSDFNSFKETVPTKSEVSTTYLSKSDATSLYIHKTEEQTFLKTDIADSVYLTKNSAESTYLKEASANDKYALKSAIPSVDNFLTKDSAASTYLTQTNAESAYQKKSELNTALDNYITKKYANDNLVTQESLSKQKVILHAVKEISPQGAKPGAKITFSRTDNIVQVSFGGLSWGMFGILPYDEFKQKRENAGYKWFQFSQKTNPSDENSYSRLQLVPVGYRAEGAVITTICLDNGEAIGTLYIGGKDDENIIVLRIANNKVDAAVSQNFRVSPAFYLTTDALPQETRGNKIVVPS